jgi:hypothetical protein
VPDDNLRYEERTDVYPNPAASSINLKYTSDEKGKLRVAIYNMSGMLVQVTSGEKTRAEYTQQLNVSHLQMGIYYVEIIIEGKRHTTKFLKK